MGKVCFFKKVLVLNPYPQTPFPRKGAILLGLPPLVPVGGFAPATPFLNKQEVYRQTEAEQVEICSAYTLSFCPAYCTRSPYTTPSPTVLI